MATQKQLEMMKDLLTALTKHGYKGISIRRGERRHYAALERDGLVYFVGGFGRGDNYSIRLTNKGKEWAWSNFAYAYKDQPQRGQTTYQNVAGKVTLVVNGVAP